VLAEVAGAGGFDPKELDGRSSWVAIERIEAVLAAARGRMPSDDVFKRASAHQLAEAYGPIRYVLWATSPGAVYAAAGRTYKLVTTNGDVTILAHTRTSMDARISRPVPVTRLHCLLQQAQTAALPTIWGLPPAMLREDGCVALGDPACVYHLRWFDVKRWLPSAIGLAGGVAAAMLLTGTHYVQAAGSASVALLGLSLGYIYELHHAGSRNVRVGEEINAALRQLADEEAEARRELLSLHQRQRDWARLLEEETTERAHAFQLVLERIGELQRARDTTLRGFSHDLNNPLAVLRANIQYLREKNNDAEVSEVLADFDQASAQISTLLSELMKAVTGSVAVMQLSPQRIDVGTITDRLRRRVRALVYGRDIRASVFRTREAPEAITMDALFFDRVLDNILTNAAKYTEIGSIVIELDGTPTSLVIKVSDTGRGIASEDLDRTFRPRGVHGPTGYGVGLSVVVQLLGQVGGRLEVMSKPAHGTTFWVHFPIEVPTRSDTPRDGGERAVEPYEQTLGRVLTIRRLKSA
jgi:signal transduction histidine kinase